MNNYAHVGREPGFDDIKHFNKLNIDAKSLVKFHRKDILQVNLESFFIFSRKYEAYNKKPTPNF